MCGIFFALFKCQPDKVSREKNSSKLLINSNKNNKIEYRLI